MLRENAFLRRTELQLATLGVSRVKYTRAYSSGSYYINFYLMIPLISILSIKTYLNYINF